MKDIIKKHIPFFILFLSTILLIFSSIMLYNTGNTEVSIKSDKIYKFSKIDLKKYKKDKIYILQNIENNNIRNKNKEIRIKDLLNYTKNTKVTIYNDCWKKNKIGSKLYNNCITKYYFHKYDKLLNEKWIIDKRVCWNIKTIFWEKSYIYNRCIFIYEVNKWIKFLNISWCNNLSIKNPYWFSRDQCRNNIIYTSFWNDNTIWKYLKTVKERKDWKNSALYTDILNKNWNILDWKVQWIDFFEFDLAKYLKKEYNNNNNNNNNN